MCYVLSHKSHKSTSIGITALKAAWLVSQLGEYHSIYLYKERQDDTLVLNIFCNSLTNQEITADNIYKENMSRLNIVT